MKMYNSTMKRMMALLHAKEDEGREGIKNQFNIAMHGLWDIFRAYIDPSAQNPYCTQSNSSTKRVTINIDEDQFQYRMLQDKILNAKTQEELDRMQSDLDKITDKDKRDTLNELATLRSEKVALTSAFGSLNI